MQADLSILKLITEASVLVQIIMAILVLMSITSWAMIFIKYRQLRDAQNHSKSFEDRFWSGISLKRLYSELKNTRPHEGLDRVFYEGYQEFIRLTNRNTELTAGVVPAAQRAMRVAESRELDRYDRNLSFLATVGSTSPYIGLFGTVWGIMNSFLSIGQMKQATLAVVAPGIAEALIATAFGLFAAIPAVIAYNKFSDTVDRLSVSFENFREEFVALLDRHVLTKNTSVGISSENSAGKHL
ncbi:MAG: protein TolQ [Thiotrichaceae bacterium]